MPGAAQGISALILFHLFGAKVLRFSELENAIPAISQKMLIQRQALCPALDALLQWVARRDERAND